MKLKNSIIGLVAGCMFFSACTDGVDSPYTNTDVVDGIPVTATLKIATNEANVFTRAQSEEVENAIKDLYVLIFNADGSFSSSEFFNEKQLDDFGRNYIKLNTTSGKKKVYAIANTESNAFTTSDATNLKGLIDEFVARNDNSLTEWLELSALLSEPQVDWTGGQGTFAMSGFFVEGDGTGLKGDNLTGDAICTFNMDGTLQEAGIIQLARMASLISFEITDAANSKGEFTPISWEVHNVPKSVYLYRRDALGTPTTEFFSAKGNIDNEGKFDFYMLENRQAPKSENSGTPSYTEAEMNWRELYTLPSAATPLPSEKIYTNAPEYGTYVIIHGTYKGKALNPFLGEDKDGDASGTVYYYVHLGYANSKDDFSVPRNAKYTYRIKVAGVDNIVVEVDPGTDENPPADGSILFYDADLIEVDAHYERREITIDCNVNQFICGIETPMTNFVYKDITELSAEDKDIDWALFMLKDEANGKNIDFRKGSRTAGLMDVEELTAYVTANKGQGEKAFYVYIAENFYEDMDFYKFVNFEKGIGERKSRKMMISVERKSNNQFSSIASARYIIQQKPITTIFNLNTVNDANAWGIEWFDENLGEDFSSTDWTVKAAAGISKSGDNLPTGTNRKENGLQNTKSAIGAGGIGVTSDDIDYDSYPHSVGAKAYAACMSRNRDEDGNGKIDPDEIKWYLPAEYQFADLWIGMPVIPEEATLYPKVFRDNNVWRYYHYLTSNNRVFWAEEGCAFGDNSQSWAAKYHIRCARNLTNTEATPLRIAERSGNIVKVGDRLPEDAVRSPLWTGQLESYHHEYSDANKLWRAIEIGDDIDARTFGTLINDVRDGNDPCKSKGTGWRSPSQRELLLFTSLGLATGNSQSTTCFSLGSNILDILNAPGGNSVDRSGFAYNGQVFLMNNNSTSNRVRCVRDVQP